MGEPTTRKIGGFDPRHEVTLSREFLIQTTEVTQGQFREVMGFNPSVAACCGGACPVDNVPWDQAAAYCNALSDRALLEKCYRCVGGGPGVTCETSPTADTIYDCEGYRLPTEAEWEYAARAGTTTATYAGELQQRRFCDEPALDDIAWYCGNSAVDYSTSSACQSPRDPGIEECCSLLFGPRPVGLKRPNAWGLHDMLGNVSEWVHDRYVPYPATAITDPVSEQGGVERLLRGGDCANRYKPISADFRDLLLRHENERFEIGFRPVRTCHSCAAPPAPAPPVGTGDPFAPREPPPDYERLLAVMSAMTGPVPPELVQDCALDDVRGPVTPRALVRRLERDAEYLDAFCAREGELGWRCELLFMRGTPLGDNFSVSLELSIFPDGTVDRSSFSCIAAG